MLPLSSLTAEIVCLWWTAEIYVGHKAPFVSHQPSQLIWGVSRFTSRVAHGPEDMGANRRVVYWTVDPIRQTSACGSSSALVLSLSMAKDNDGKGPGSFFSDPADRMSDSQRTRSMPSGEITATLLSVLNRTRCVPACVRCEANLVVFVQSLWTHVQPLCGFRPLVQKKLKKRFCWVTEPENPQTALWLIGTLTCCPPNVVYDKFLFQPVHHLVQPHVGLTVISCYPAPSSPLWTLLPKRFQNKPLTEVKAAGWRGRTLLILRSDRWGSFWTWIETVCSCCTWGSLMLWCCFSG